MFILEYEGYLQENKLANMINKLCDYSSEFEFVCTQFCFENHKRYKYDVAFKYNSLVYLIEFDGSQHYTDINRIKTDEFKNSLALQHNFKIVRIPFFVQLTTETFAFYFPEIKENVVIKQNFPHGFISQTRFCPPSFFCLEGYKRYEKEFLSLPKNVQSDINVSLFNKAKEILNSVILNDFDVNLLTDRTIAGRNKKANSGGYCGGRVPYGYSVFNKELVINECEAEIVRKIFLDYENGCSKLGIAKNLNKNGLTTRKGGYWYASNITSIINNKKLYQGYYQYGENEIVKGKHKPILEYSNLY